MFAKVLYLLVGKRLFSDYSFKAGLHEASELFQPNSTADHLSKYWTFFRHLSGLFYFLRQFYPNLIVINERCSVSSCGVENGGLNWLKLHYPHGGSYNSEAYFSVGTFIKKLT